jgi:proteasome lid subunit RPN8/RPN11
MVVDSAVIDAIVAHARATAPAECCGLLLGRAGEVLASRPTRNAAEEPTRRFLIDPKDHVDGRREARARGLEVIGFYHSHPNGAAEPSVTDLAEATYPDHLYAIASLAGTSPELKLFRLHDGRFRACAYRTS